VKGKGKQRDTIRVTGNKKGVVGEVTGFLGILNNIDQFGEAKRDNKKGKREEKKMRSCSNSDDESKTSGKKNNKRPAGRKVSVSACSDDSHSDHKSDNKRRKSGSSDSDDCSDTGSESSCSKKSNDKGKRRRLAKYIGRKGEN
jgi:hypothetical protein